MPFILSHFASFMYCLSFVLHREGSIWFVRLYFTFNMNYSFYLIKDYYAIKAFSNILN